MGEMKAKSELNSNNVSHLSILSPPVGTVMAFAGEWPPYKDKSQNLRHDEEKIGWMLCDGRTLDHQGDNEKTIYTTLYEVIGTVHGKPSETQFKLPDLRGRFLRGADRDSNNDPDYKKRKDPNKDIHMQGVGSYQHWATRAPHSDFQVVNKGRNKEPYAKGLEYRGLLRRAKKGEFDMRKAVPNWGSPNGDPTNEFWGKGLPTVPCLSELYEIVDDYKVSGGDRETRPINIAVNWIIKVK